MPTNRSTSTDGPKIVNTASPPKEKLQDATTSTADVSTQPQPAGTGKKKNKKKKKKKNNASGGASNLDLNNNSVDGPRVVSAYTSSSLRSAAANDNEAFLEHKLYNHAFDQLSNSVVNQVVPAATSSNERQRQQERIKHNLGQELESYAERMNNRLRPLYDKEATFEQPVPTTLEQAEERRGDTSLGDEWAPLQLVLRIDLSRPNQIKFFSSSRNGADRSKTPTLPQYEIDFTLPAILSFLLFRLRPQDFVSTQTTNKDPTSYGTASKKLNQKLNQWNTESLFTQLRFTNVDGSLMQADKTCPFHLQGLQQISTSNSNMLLALIQPTESMRITDRERCAASFQKKVASWLRKYTARHLFFTELDHVYDYNPPNNGPGFAASYPSACRTSRQSGVFDTCKVLPIHVDETVSLSEYVEIDESPGLVKVFERQPSLLWNCGLAQREHALLNSVNPDSKGSLSEFSEHALGSTNLYLQQWPCLAIGYNLLREPRIMCEYFARTLPSEVSNYVGIRLTFPTRRQLDKISLREHSSKYNYNTYSHSRLRGGEGSNGADSLIPTLALCIRGHRNIKQNLRLICGPSNLSIAITKCSASEGELNLNGTYKDCFETDQSYFWSPLNNGAAFRVLALFFGGRLATPPENLKSSVEAYPDGIDPLLDLIRKEASKNIQADPEPAEEDAKNSQTAAAEPPAPAAPQKSKKSKKKSKKKGKAAKTDDDDIDALVAKLGLECYEAPTQEDSLFYTLTLAPVEELLLMISPAVESHLMAHLQNSCLEVGFKIKSCNACTLQVEEDAVDCPLRPGDARLCVDPNVLNIGRVGQLQKGGKAWCADDMVRVFYPDEAKKAFEKILEGDDYSDEDSMDKCERQHELVGARYNMSPRCAYVMHLSRENAHSLAQSLLSRLYIQNILTLADDVSPNQLLNKTAYDQFINMFAIRLFTPSTDGELLKTMQKSFSLEYTPLESPLISKYAKLPQKEEPTAEDLLLATVEGGKFGATPAASPPLPTFGPANAFTSTKLERSTILEQESEQLALLVCHSEISTQFVDVIRELFSLNDYYYRSPLLYQHRGNDYPTYPEFELLLMRSFSRLDAQIAHLLCPLEIGNPRYHSLMQDLIHGDGVILVLRAVCAKERLKEHLQYIEQSHYSNSSPGLFEAASGYWPFFTVCSDNVIHKILPTLGPLYEDSSTRPLARFLAPLRGSNGHEHFGVETFSFVLVRPHAVKQGLAKILARISQCGFEVVAIKKTLIQADQIDDLGACRAPENGRQGFQPLIREMWAKDLTDSECVVMVVKRVNAVYQMTILAGLDHNDYGGTPADGGLGMYSTRPHSTIGQDQQEGGYWQHNRSAIKNGPSLRSLAGSSLIQNAVWVPDSYDEAMEEIKRFFPAGLPADVRNNPIIESENFPECPAYDTEVAMHLRKIIHVHKGTRIYPETPDSRRNAGQSDRYMGSLSAFSTSFTSVNQTSIAIIILDQEMFKVQELIDVDDSDSEQEPDPRATLAESEDDVIVASLDDNDQNFGDDETTSSEVDANAPQNSRHRYYTANADVENSTSSGSSLGDHDEAPSNAHIRPAVQVTSSSSDQLLTEEQNEDSDVDVETNSQPTVSDAERLKQIREKKAKKHTESCAAQTRAEPTIASAISEKTTRLNSRLHTNVPQSLLSATKYKQSSSSPCYSSSSSGSNSISANYAAGRMPPPIMPESSSSDPKQQVTESRPAGPSSRGENSSDRPLSQPNLTGSGTSLNSGRVSSQEPAPKKNKRNMPSYLDTSTPAYINVLKALTQASYRVIGMRRTWLRDDQAANLFGINYADFANFSPTGVEESINYEWAQKLSSGSSLILAVQRHGAAYALLDTTLENFKDYDAHIFKTKTRQQALHFTASLFSRLPKDAVWKIEHDPC